MHQRVTRLPQNGDVVEAQKLKALGIRNRIEAEIGDAAAAAADVLPVVHDCVGQSRANRK